MVAKRGVMFELSTTLAGNADAALEALDKKIQEIQRRANITVSATMAAHHQARATAGTGLVGAAPAASGSTSGSSSSNAHNAERARLRRRDQMRREAEERDRLHAEKTAKIVEKANEEALAQQTKDLKKAETERKKAADARAAEARRAADAEIKEIARVQSERRKALSAATKAHDRYWSDFEKFGQRSKSARDKQEARDAKQSAAGARQGRADQAQWDLILGGGGQTGTAGMRGPSRGDIADPFGLAGYGKQQSAERKRRDREAQDALARQREGYARLRESVLSTTDAITRLGQGVAYLGLIGERDLGRLSDSLLAVRGTTDAIRGGVGTARDMIGLTKNLREVGGMGGVGGIARAAIGLGPKAIPAMTGAAGASTATAGATAAAAGAATPAMPVGAITAASLAVAAAIGKAALEIREATFTGLGNAPRVGSVVGRYADATVGLGARVAGVNMAVNEAISNATAPLGMLDRDKELRAEQAEKERIEKHRRIRAKYDWIPLWGRYAAYAQASEDTAFANHQTERKIRFAEDDKRLLLAAGETTSRANAIENENARSAMDAKQQMLASQFRQQETIDPDARPFEQIAFRRRSLNLRRQELAGNVGIVEEERQRINQQIATAPVGPARDEAIREREQLEQRIIALKQQEMQLSREQRQIDIDGAKQRLQGLRDAYQKQVELVKSARNASESFEVRWAKMSYGERQAVMASKRRLLKGEQLSIEEVNNLENADEDSQRRVREYLRKRGHAMLQEQDAREVDMGGTERERYEDAKNAMSDLRESSRNARQEEENKLSTKHPGAGITIGSTVDNKITIDVQADDTLEENIRRELDEQMSIFLKDQNERIRHWVEEAVKKAQGNAEDFARRINNQGRVSSR